MQTSDLNTFTYVIAFVILVLPFAILWFIVYRRLKKDLKTALNYCAFSLCTLLALACYFAITGNAAQFFLDGPVSNLIGVSSYIGFLCTIWPIVILFFVTMALTIKFFVYRKKKN